MKISDLKKIVDKAYQKAGGTKSTAVVEVWLGEKEFDIESLGQFSIVPDLVIHLKKKGK